MSHKVYKKTRLVQGAGINDADYAVAPRVNGMRGAKCPFYAKWEGMLKRCYCTKYHKTHPAYIECRVVDEWLVFSNFKKWMITQDWQGNELDKDILIQNNKLYSPSTCIFVSRTINKIIDEKKSNEKNLKRGVRKDKRTGRYYASCYCYGKSKFLGSFESETEAHESYKIAKYKHIAEVALSQVEPIRSALLNYVIGE